MNHYLKTMNCCTDNDLRSNLDDLETSMVNYNVILVESQDEHLLVPPPALGPGPGGIALRVEKRKPRQQLTEQERKRRRTLSNRKSAKASRDHRRQLLTDLTSKVATFSAENKALAKTNLEMCDQIKELKGQLQLVLTTIARRAAAAKPTNQFGKPKQGFQSQSQEQPPQGPHVCGSSRSSGDGGTGHHSPDGHGDVGNLPGNNISDDEVTLSHHGGQRMGKGVSDADHGSLMLFNMCQSSREVAFA